MGEWLEEMFNRFMDFFEEHYVGCMFAIGLFFAIIAVVLAMSVDWS